METIFEVNYQNPIGDIDDDIDDELTPFQYALEELRRYAEPEFYIKLKGDYRVHFYIYADITACYEDIVKSVKRVKNNWTGKDDIWFCEQGSDFYFYYEIKDKGVELEYKKGPDVGIYNGKIPDMKLFISKLEYIQVWETLFKELSTLIEEKLNKKINLPF
ncbi:hypothetical protein [Gilliamella sp. WF3-4]|jgi:hypothetical protein|uniref:hypothetical protein n=1 Tax=Gilliamella sp. WF3-4 TaxID=3120255 RepID=UPI00080D8F78|nr:hypothetical protein [Gilliamella apicola]OCG19355.1 hypothetical protein A9G47_03660 [Gilliamella apicola]